MVIQFVAVALAGTTVFRIGWILRPFVVVQAAPTRGRTTRHDVAEAVIGHAGR